MTRCDFEGHHWSAWSDWEAMLPRFTPTSVPEINEPVVIPKRRIRQCRRCGKRQAQDGAGNIGFMV